MADCTPDPDPSGFHALVIPYPLQGHIIPMMQFAEKLATRGLTVTFVTTHHAHAQSTKVHSKGSPVQPGLDIRSAQISDGLSLDFDRSARFSDFVRSLTKTGGELEQLIHNLNKRGPLISDEDNTLIDYIPGVPRLHPKDLPSFLQEQDSDSQYFLDLVFKSIQSSRGADWVLCNSFDDLESTEMKLVPPVLHVGPLLPSGFWKGCAEGIIGTGTSIQTEYDCSAWLNTKPNASVIYVSFGSMIHLSKAQLEEIAMGLKDSGQPFLWVVRPDIVASTVSDGLPNGFLDEIGSQGLVVPWCNQLRVLSHPSVAGFITHCGWNSMLESMALGVPMLGFPAWSEQYTNCKLMADEWKIGIRLKLIAREDICGAIRKLLSDEGKEMKINVEGLSNSAKTATIEGGSSYRNIETFVQGLKARRTKFMKSVD